MKGSARIYFPFLEDMERKMGYPQLEKLIIMRMKSREELGVNSRERISEVEIPLFVTQAREFIARGSAYIQDTHSRFYCGTNQVFLSQLLIT